MHTYTHTSPEQFTGGAGSLPPPPEVKDSFQAGILSKVLSLFFFLLHYLLTIMESSGLKPKKNLGDKIRLCSPFLLGVTFLFVSDT